MVKMTMIAHAFVLIVLFTGFSTDGFAVIPNSIDGEGEQWSIKVPTEGNSWFITKGENGSEKFHDLRSFRWADDGAVLRTWFHLEKTGLLHVGLETGQGINDSEFEVSFMGHKESIKVSDEGSGKYTAGIFSVDAPGYYFVDITGSGKTTGAFALPANILLGGEAAQGKVSFSDREFFYWGRRGPSVHLSYQVPEEAGDVLYFYNEVAVPEGNDVPGSFYMANGFGQGYFGFQVNSEVERRVLFSVWSPYETDNPEEIPEDQRVMSLRRGKDVVINDFGNEGSGGQSFLRYNWQAGVTYSFLLKVEPAHGYDNKTDYTAWFFAPEAGQWQMIASWRRPLISTYATRIHSFLENFSTRTGPIARKAYYNNQWIMDTSGQWFELTRARFTADATARAGARLDYAGGIAPESQGFFMRNCGFFNDTTPIDSWFIRESTGVQPVINFESLP